MIAWAEFTGTKLIDIYEDAGLSGARADNRPAVQQAIAEACRRRCALVVMSMSRLSRSVRDMLAVAERLEKAGADLVSLSEDINTTSATGRLVFGILALLSQFEREQLGERTKAAMDHLRREGRRVSGHVPFGFDLSGDGRSLVANPTEQDALDLIGRLRCEGLSLREITRRLMSAGIRPKRAQTWSPSSVAAVLARAREAA